MTTHTLTLERTCRLGKAGEFGDHDCFVNIEYSSEYETDWEVVEIIFPEFTIRAVDYHCPATSYTRGDDGEVFEFLVRGLGSRERMQSDVFDEMRERAA